MSGHNKWSSIKHKKGAADAKRGKLFTKIIRELTVAARSGGGDPNSNARLRTAMIAARDANMPKDTMVNAIKRGTGELDGGVALEEVVYEGYGPGGTAVLAYVTTDNKNRAVADIRGAFTKAGGNMGESDCVSWMFDKRGLVVLEPGPAEDAVIEIALDAGADDVMNEGASGFSVYTPPEKMEEVRAALEGKNLKVVRAEISMVPKTMVPLDEKNAESLLGLIAKLEEMDDVQNVYSNYTVDDAVMEKLAERMS